MYTQAWQIVCANCGWKETDRGVIVSSVCLCPVPAHKTQPNNHMQSNHFESCFIATGLWSVRLTFKWTHHHPWQCIRIVTEARYDFWGYFYSTLFQHGCPLISVLSRSFGPSGSSAFWIRSNYPGSDCSFKAGFFFPSFFFKLIKPHWFQAHFL